MVLKITLIIKTAHFVELKWISDINRVLLLKVFFNNRAESNFIICNGILFDSHTFNFHLGGTLIFYMAKLSAILTYHLSLLYVRECFKTFNFWGYFVLYTSEFLRVFIWNSFDFFFLRLILIFGVFIICRFFLAYLGLQTFLILGLIINLFLYIICL